MTQMRAQSFIASLLMLALIVAAPRPVMGQQSGESTIESEEKLTAEEEREARLIAEQFIKRFETSDDLLAVIDDLYVKDFSARLRANPNTMRYLVSLEPSAVSQATDHDLRRYYAALLKAIYRLGILWALDEHNRKTRGDENESRLDEVLPPDVLVLMENDPTLAKMLAEDKREVEDEGNNPDKRREKETQDSEEGETSDAEDVTAIKSVERLRSYTSTLEQISKLVKEHLRRLHAPETFAALQDFFREPDAEAEADTMQPRVGRLNSDYFGSLKGTRVICVNVMAYHMDLIRVDGKLKILNVYTPDD